MDTVDNIMKRLEVYCAENGVDGDEIYNVEKVQVIDTKGTISLDVWELPIKKPSVTDLKRVTLTKINDTTRMRRMRQLRRHPLFAVVKTLCEKNNVDMESILLS